MARKKKKKCEGAEAEDGKKKKSAVVRVSENPVGVDPIWYMAQNEILFINSEKMKVALILGVFQMTLGIFLKGCNDAYNKRCIDFFFEFLPQLVMFMALFGFMDLMVVKKWLY